MKIPWSQDFQRFMAIRLPEPAAKIKKGIYHFRREAGGAVTRFHLRVEEEGSGLLLANSSIAARLSSSGVLIAKGLLDQQETAEIEKSVRQNFRSVDDAQLHKDITKIRGFIDTLSNSEDNYPIFNLDDAALTGATDLFAPFHAQMPAAEPQVINPLIAKLWDYGIVHVTFTAGNSADEAVENIERAEDTGMISGLRAIASWLMTSEVLRRSALAGVDYITVPVLAVDAQMHDRVFGAGDFAQVIACFAECRKQEVCPVAEIPLIQENFTRLEELLELLESHGVRNVLYYAIAIEHQASGLSGLDIIRAAELVHELAESGQVRYVWQPPVTARGDLVSILKRGPRTAGDVSIRVDFDGNVYPARGPMKSAGNLLRDRWETIWDDDAFRRYRGRVESPTRCEICPGLAICAADCPADPRGWASETTDEQR